MKQIKKISPSLLYLLLILVLSPGCKKFLDRKPLTATLEDLPGGGLEGQVLGLYDALRANGHGGDGFNSLPYMCFHSIRSDDAIYAVDPGASSYQPWLDQYQYDKTAWFSGQYWADHYSVIGKANTALQFSDSLHLTDSGSVVNIAEAKFVRAFAYFDLVRTYGQVPLIIKRIYNSSEANVEKSSVADIWKQIDEDLDYADAHLPMHWDAPYLGRITSGASKTLHAKAYIFRSMWTETLNKTQEVISSNQYSLSPSYYDNFNYAKALGPESIFEIQAFGSPGGTQRYDCEWAEPQQARGSGDWNLGWGWNIPDDPLVNAFEPRDPRKKFTVLIAGQPVGLYGITDSVPKASLIAGAKYLNAKVFTDPAVRKAYADQGSHFLNHLMLRYADVLLMHAEASNELGDGGTAETDLEMIRKRARDTAVGALPMVTFASKDQMRTAIQHERQVEFGMEAERFFDLVRWNLAITVLGPAGYKDKNKYYPLPQDVVTQSNGHLTQNPDYP